MKSERVFTSFSEFKRTYLPRLYEEEQRQEWIDKGYTQNIDELLDKLREALA